MTRDEAYMAYCRRLARAIELSAAKGKIAILSAFHGGWVAVIGRTYHHVLCYGATPTEAYNRTRDRSLRQ